MEAGSLNDALGLLEKSLKMNKTVLGDEDISNASIYSTLSKVYLKKKDYDKSLAQLSKVWELSEAKFGKDSLEIAQVYLDLAKVYFKKKDYEDAINNQLRAIDNFKQNDHDPEIVAKAMITASEWYNKNENLEEAIRWLRETEDVYIHLHGSVDKKTCKIKRDIALLLLKGNQYNDALDEVIQVEEQERTLYGETSLQLGRTYKLIGTLYILGRKINEAKVYLQKAYTIFELKGATKLLKEVKTKLHKLKTSLKMDEDLAAEEENNSSGEEGTEEEQDESSKKPKRKIKKKSVPKTKKKKSAVRNNFMAKD